VRVVESRIVLLTQMWPIVPPSSESYYYYLWPRQSVSVFVFVTPTGVLVATSDLALNSRCAAASGMIIRRSVATRSDQRGGLSLIFSVGYGVGEVEIE
jgi:hypothetical protein